MMRKKENYKKQIIFLLEELSKSYPKYNLGRHLSTALDEYGDVWGLTDKEFVYALTKYKSEIDMDVPHTDDVDVEKIVREGMNLENILKEEEDYNGDNY